MRNHILKLIMRMRNPYILRIFVTSLLLMLMYLFLVLFFNFPMPEFYNNLAKSMAEAKSKPYVDLANSIKQLHVSKDSLQHLVDSLSRK